jgi:hypothetical protein
MKINNSSLEEAEKDLKDIENAVHAVRSALDKSFNVNFNTTDLNKFR